MSESSSNPSSNASKMTIDIRPMIEDVSQVMTKHITNILSGVIGEYHIYKETHDTIMGLPFVRRLQERISELEDNNGTTGTAAATATATTGGANTREDEISQLQVAIADLNRYIHALESKVGMKSVSEIGAAEDEESVKLEIREEDDGDDSSSDDTEGGDGPCIVSSTHKNVIITAAAVETDAEAEAEEADAEDAEAEVEAEAEDTEAEEAEAEEAEIEVSEVKIKGKTYFTTDAVNGIIYACVDDDVGDEVGVFKNGVAVFNKTKK